MPPALRIPARLGLDEFRQNVTEARGLISKASEFMVKQLEHTAAKSAVFDLPRLIQNSDGARQITQRAVQAIATDVGKLTSGAVNSALPVAFDGFSHSVRGGAAVMNTVGVPAMRGLASAWLPIIARAGAAYLAYKTVEQVIGAVSHELATMTEIASKARERGLSPEMFQAFVAAAKGAADEISTLEGALDVFFQASKRRFNENIAPQALDAEKEQWSELAKAIRSARFEGLASEGPKTFLSAGADQSRQLLGVLQTIREITSAGQELEALDIAEKAFGSRLADNLRTGKMTIEEIADTVQTKLLTGVKDGSIFSSATVQRAKEIDDQLKEAWRTVDKNLRPSMETLDNAALSIKSSWVDIVKLIAEGARLLSDLSRVSGPSAAQQATQFRHAETILENKLRDKGLTPSQRKGLEEQLRAAQAKTAQAEASLVPEMPILPLDGPTVADVPLPRRRPLNIPQDAPAKASEKGSSTNRFDTAADSVERRTAALQAETASIDLNTQARERARVVAELEAVAKQVNAAAGLGENVITAEQRDRINEVADAYSRAADAIDKARSPLATFARESQNLNRQLNEFAASSLGTLSDELAAVVTGTRSAKDAFKSLTNSIISDLARIAIQKTITGPLASAMNGLFDGGLGSFFGGPSGVLPGGSPLGMGGIGHNADGTDDWRGGPTWVGERGPEVIDLPRGSRVTPNNVLFGGGRPRVNVQVNNYSGADVSAGNERDDGRGGMDMEVVVGQMAARQASRPGSKLSNALDGRNTLVRR